MRKHVSVSKPKWTQSQSLTDARQMSEMSIKNIQLLIFVLQISAHDCTKTSNIAYIHYKWRTQCNRQSASMLYLMHRCNISNLITIHIPNLSLYFMCVIPSVFVVFPNYKGVGQQHPCFQNSPYLAKLKHTATSSNVTFF